MENFNNILLEIFYVLIGLMFTYTSIICFTDKQNKKRFGSSIFWLLLAITFIFGPYMPGWVVGIIIVVMAGLTAFKQVTVTTKNVPNDNFAEKSAKKIGIKIFIPSVCIAIIALLVAQLTPISGSAAIGISAVVALVVALFITKSPLKNTAIDGDRLTQSIGPFCILPQLLTALGALFTAAGVGDIITNLISQIIPTDSRLFGVTAYCVGMALFTIIMGNAFAAFTVVTVGVGIPFVISQGADPVIASAIAITAGYCGTLITPMAANFNAVPAALLEMKNKYGIIKYQFPIAILSLFAHILLMYFLAF